MRGFPVALSHSPDRGPRAGQIPGTGSERDSIRREPHLAVRAGKQADCIYGRTPIRGTFPRAVQHRMESRGISTPSFEQGDGKPFRSTGAIESRTVTLGDGEHASTSQCGRRLSQSCRISIHPEPPGDQANRLCNLLPPDVERLESERSLLLVASDIWRCSRSCREPGSGAGVGPRLGFRATDDPPATRELA